VYDGKREQAGVLNYQDLLMRAAALLRSNPDVRRYFRSRFTHLLVDEFQDTDPSQAEVMLLLTATDPEETDWEACRPVAGSLFVVGDPKQSIYRFRRADIVTYTKVRDIIDRDGNGIVTLQANFRSRPELIEWVNRVFGSQKGFPDQPTPYAPAYVSLEAGAPAPGPDDAQAVMRLDLPKNLDKDEIIAYETDLVARTIRRTVERSRARDTTDDARTRAEPGASFSDFMVITRNTHRLGAYAARLQEYDVPHRVVGGNALNLSGELDMLAACLDATINPDNPVALVRVLRGPLFGISDAQLYAFKRLGGEFNFQTPGRADMDHDLIKPIAEAYERLGNFHAWLKTLPPVSAIRRMTMDLGLPVPAGLQRGGNGHAGSLMKAIELIGEKSRGAWSLSKLVELVTGLSTGLEKHDTLPALERGEPSVMVMNLHKVKGLEAPLVFLADANGGAGGHKVTLHVDRSRGPGHGYMAMTRPTTGFHADVIATPRGWKTWEEKEKKFAEAEEIRLMYVAATRAGAGLTITQRHSYNNRNPWRFFEADVKDAPGVPDPGEVQPREAEALTISPEDVAGAQKLIRQGWQTVTTPTYGVAGAKALTGKPEARFSVVEEHGTLWGTAIHRLLEAAPSSDDTQLHALARSVWEDLQLSPDLIHQAMETVRSVLASDLWARASAASRVLTETPFQTMVTESSDSEAHQEILMRGVIDLAFCENGSWVIVDYKTDRRPRGEIASLTEQYADQVMRYADAWRSLTNEPVHEAGLFFTHHREYVPVRKGHVG
jgi:ATP-dependent helicase/nuclease subunit A